MLISGKKIRALRDKKKKILTLVVFENFFLNEIKNHNPPPPLQVKWSVPYLSIAVLLVFLYLITGNNSVLLLYACPTKCH